MKRSYNSSNPPPTLPQTSPYQAAYAQPASAAPPLPPGPPPPPPSGAAPYASAPGYGYGAYGAAQDPQQQQQQQVMASHPQYPGYGYGGSQAAAPAAAAATPYGAAPASSDPHAAAAAAAAQQYAAYYAAYAQQATAAAGGSASPYSAAPAAPNPYGAQSAPPASHPYGAPPPSGSPLGAPPYKRTRYDQPPPPPPQSQPPLPPGPPPPAPGYGAPPGAPMPPSILPPVGGRQGRTGPPPPMGGGRGPPPPGSMRGGGDMYGGGGGDYGSPMRGGPPPRGMMDSRGPGGGSGGMRGGPGPRGGGYNNDGMMGGGGGYGGPGPLGPRGAPMGPRGNQSRGPMDDRRSGGPRGGGGGPGPSPGGPRAMSGLPGSGKYGPPSGPSGPRSMGGAPSAPRGPKNAANARGGPNGMHAGNAGISANQQPSRRERKWGSGVAASSPAPSKRDREAADRDREEGGGAKRTFTDFRIEALGIAELEWEWQAERIEQEMRRAAEELDRQVKDKEESEREPSSAADLLSDPTAAVKEEEHDEAAGDETGNMSIDQIPPSAAAEPELAVPSDPTVLATVASGKHRRDEDDDEPSTQQGPNANDAPVSTAASEHPDHASKAKKVRVDEAQPEQDGGEVSLEALQPTAQGEQEQGDAVKPEQAVESATAEQQPQVEVKLESEANAEEDDDDVDGAPLEQTDDVDGPVDPTVKAEPPSSPIAARTAPPPPPSSRENSRLRIYFASPVTSVSSYTMPGDAALGRGDSVKASSVAPSSKAGSVPPQPHPPASSNEEGAPVNGGLNEPVPTPAEPLAASEAVQGQAPPAAEVMGKIEEEVEREAAADESEPSSSTLPQPEPEVKGKAAEVDDVDGEPVDGEKADGEPVEAEAAAEAQQDDAVAVPQPASEDPTPTANGKEAGEPEHALGKDANGVDSTTADTQDQHVTQVSQPPRESSVAPSVAGTVVLPPEPAADRISISYARNTRRIVLDADIIDSVKVFRSEGRVELTVRCTPALMGEGENQVEDDFRVCKGVLVESLDVEADDYIVMDRGALTHAWDADKAESSDEPSSLDPLLPPLHRLLASSADGEASAPHAFSHETITVSARLDRQNPLTEARWVKTGEVDNWIVSLGIAAGASPRDASKLSEWRSKIKIVDPDPPPTIQHVLDSWASSSNAGTLEERREFVKTHMSDLDNVVEILLRLTRGDRAGPSQYTASAGYTQAPAVGALAASLDAPFADQQTQVSLAVLAMFRLSMTTAQRAGIAREEMERQVGDVIRIVPSHLQFKSIDGIFREVVKGQSGSVAASGSGGGGSRGGRKKGRRD
ncbi:hypothetical protein Rhopal_003815-T1 [Rhodotorula paludigena]|uniref:Proteasome subunit alpha type 1 n=1 Tax=Rhodotorula paludigena TaxID=86838 RepID=A0AAV5GEH8_9BASI|nr:hypothetical protein Rhopal_003815-T1 [Rhodotorula paludigena]